MHRIWKLHYGVKPPFSLEKLRAWIALKDMGFGFFHLASTRGKPRRSGRE